MRQGFNRENRNSESENRKPSNSKGLRISKNTTTRHLKTEKGVLKTEHRAKNCIPGIEVRHFGGKIM